MSNRLTFSLASLILVFALVFSAMPVMAHTADPHTPADPADDHRHPMVSISALPADADDRTPGTQAVDGDDATAEHQVTYVIQYPGDPNNANSLPTAADIATGDYGVGVTDANGFALSSSFDATVTSATIGDPTATPAGDPTKVDVVVTVTFDAAADGVPDEVLLNFAVNANSYTSKQAAPQELNQTNLLVRATPITVLRNAPDRVVPTLAATQTTANGVITVMLDFDKALSAAPTVRPTHLPVELAGTYEVGTVMAADDVATSFDYTVTVTPLAATITTGDIPPGEVTLTVTAMDEAGNALAATNNTVDVPLAARDYDDDTVPEVVVFPVSGNPTEKFDVNFTVEDEYESDTFTATDITVAITPGTDVTDAAPMAMAMATPGSFKVTVTPTPATADMLTVDASTIRIVVTATDAAGNMGEKDTFVHLGKRTYKDMTAPVLAAATVGTPDATTGAVMVTLTFDEMFTTAPTVTDSTAPTSPIAGRYMVSPVTGSGMSFMVTVAPNPLAIGDANFPGGTVMLTVTGTDADGNALAAAPVNVTLEMRDAPVAPPPTPVTFGFEMNTLADLPIPAQVGKSITIPLPLAINGSSSTNYVYTWHSPNGNVIPDGMKHNGLSLSVDPATDKYRLSGTPETVNTTGIRYIWKAVDTGVTPNRRVELPFTVTVAPADQVVVTDPVIPITLTIGSDVKSLRHDGTTMIAGERQYWIYGEIGPRTGGVELGKLTATANFNAWSVLNGGSHNGNDSFQGRDNEWRFVGDVEATTGHYSLQVYDRSKYKLQVNDDPTTVASNDAIAIYRLFVVVDRLGPTLRSARVSDGVLPEAGGPFRVTLEFDESLSATPTDAGFSVTNGLISDIVRITGSQYSALITPHAGVAKDATDATKRTVEVRLNAGLMDEHGNPSVATVAPAYDGSYSPRKASTDGPQTPTPGDITVTWDEDTMTATLTGMMPANPFASISRLKANGDQNYPDLQKFFEVGGTIDLMDKDSTDGDDDNSREVVISEILWGLDESAPTIEAETKWQFIELYNTTGAAVDITGWKLVFSQGRPSDGKIDVDQVSNRPPFGLGFDFDIGKNGRVTATKAENTTSTIFPDSIISMYRNIAYATVEKPDHDADATENRKKQLAGVPSGNDKSKWMASKRRDPNTVDPDGTKNPVAARWVYATRNAKHHTTTKFLTATTYTSSPFRINEIGNDTGSENDWVELHNTSDSDVSLKNYQLTAVTANGTDTELFDFIGDEWDNRKIPSGRFVVISTRHPQYTDLATGKDINIAADLQAAKGLQHLYLVKPNWNLPDDGKFTLILRGGHGDAHKKQGTHEYIIDVAASPEGGFEAVNIASKLWPLVGSGAPGVIKGDIKNFTAPNVYQRDGGDGRTKENFSVAGYTGIGYDIKAEVTGTNNGTPGYANDANRNTILAPEDGVVKITEIMVDVGDSARHNLPQWIELHNSSDTLGVNLNGWKVNIENAALAGVDPETNTFYATITLGAYTILPNQTVLIVSRSGEVRRQEHFPDTRVINLWTTKAHKEALEMTRSTDQVLSSRGFSIELVDKDGAPVDRVGNLDGVRHTRDEPAWAIPMHVSDERDRSRSSMLRVHEDKVALTGTMEEAWVLASDTILAFERTQSYYGDGDDISSPGYRFGGPLPVSLSKFRPERLEDGTIVVRWVTESELNNAGFNILRSETRDGQFTQMNTSLIKGQGTTSERTTYSFPDTSAKPNVVYYYQIQDVSLDGNVTTLRQSRLKGHISAAGKLTTTWGELKALQ